MINKIGVIGAGTMGHGIAEHFALHGYPVSVYEARKETLDTVKDVIRSELEFMAGEDFIMHGDIQRTLDNITLYDDMRSCVEDCDYIIEATFEDMELKRSLFAQLEEYTKPTAIIASNTSSLALSEMIKNVGPEKQTKIMVNHWYNPPHLIPLIEMSFFGNMSEEDFSEVWDMYVKVKKRPIRVLKDIPGLIANRIQQGVAREVFSLIEMNAASPEDIDNALKFGPAFRYATTGQLEVADMGGIDIWATVGDNLLSVMDSSTGASKLLKEKVSEGKLGLKSGEGFFSYPEGKKEAVKKAFYKRLITQLKTSENY